MEKFIVVVLAIVTMFFLVGYITRKNARLVAGIEILGYFNDPSYDPSEEEFRSTLKRLEEVRLLSNGVVLGLSIMLVIMTSGVLTPVNELPQVLSACLWTIACAVIVLVLLFVGEMDITNQLRKRLIGRYASKLADPQF